MSERIANRNLGAEPPNSIRRSDHRTVGAKLFEAGYPDLVLIRARDKAPARKGWLFNHPTREEAAAWTGNLGLIAQEFPAIDIDLHDKALANEIARLAGKHLGPAPVRLSHRPASLLLPYRTDRPFRKKVLTLPDDQGKVEILGDGQQYLVHGIHPEGTPYSWANKKLWEIKPYQLTLVTKEKTDAFLEMLEQEYGGSISGGRAKERPEGVQQQDLMAPSVEHVLDALRIIPNTDEFLLKAFEQDGREGWLRMAHAVYGAAGSAGEQAFVDWTATYSDDAVDLDKARAAFLSCEATYTGWPTLQMAMRHAGVDFAEDDFEAEDPPPGYVAELVAASAARDWDLPVPIASDDVIEPFPLDVLPPGFRQYVESVAQAQEVPPDVPAVNLLGATAGAAQIKYRGIRVHQDYVEPISLYLISQLHSGEGKTAAANEFRRPFERAQDLLRQLALPTIAKAEAQRDLMEQERKGIGQEIKTTRRKIREVVFLEDQGSEEERGRLERKCDHLVERLESISMKLAQCEVPSQPLLWLTEGTPEAISQHLAAQGNLVVSGSEGDLIDVFAGQYTSGGTAKLGPLLSAYSGESYSEARKDGVREVTDPRVTVVLTIQPSVIEKMRGQPEFASRGLTPRFLYSAPRSLVGTRRWDMTTRIERAGQDTYRRMIGTLLGVELHVPTPAEVDFSDFDEGEEKVAGNGAGNEERRPLELELSPTAFEHYRQYRREIEPALIDADDALSAFAAWGNKLPGQMLRIAAVLHLLERTEAGDARPWMTVVAGGTIDRAIQIAEYFRSHMALLFVEGQQTGARIVLDWVREQGEPSFRPRDLFRSKRRQFENGMDGLNATLERLEQMGWIRGTWLASDGGRPSRVYLVNPYVWIDGRADDLGTEGVREPPAVERDVASAAES